VAWGISIVAEVSAESPARAGIRPPKNTATNTMMIGSLRCLALMMISSVSHPFDKKRWFAWRWSQFPLFGFPDVGGTPRSDVVPK